MSVLLKSTVEFDDETGDNLYWQHDFGWVPRNEATIYEMNEITDEMYALQGTEFEDID